MDSIISIPDSHRDLLEKPICCAFTTVMPDGQPQTTVVWCSYDRGYVLVNTMRGFRKEKNMQANPHVTLLIFETDSPLRYLEVRGHVVEMTEDGAVAHLDELARSYTGRSPYFGKVVAEELRDQETPVLCRIAPQHAVTT
jgi:PPOX class probable F420-dependent enzyme|tara:strand:- start:1646 stop:2065 length:420 start_codon:yes stop_codon:yes gene_type:complete